MFTGMGLLVIAANLAAPRWWLVVPAWVLLGLCLAILLISTPDDYYPYKRSVTVPAVAFLFYIWLFEAGLRLHVRNMIFRPSLNHLLTLLTNTPFLIFTVGYFVLVGVFYRIELQGKQERLEDCREVCLRLNKEIDQQSGDYE